MRWGDESRSTRPVQLAAAGHRRRANQPRSLDLVPEVIGKGRCPIVDTWWQTETGQILITLCRPPRSSRVPHPAFPGHRPNRGRRNAIPAKAGFLVIRKPWPAMLAASAATTSATRLVLEPDPGIYFTGDGARPEDGYFWIMGRVDDVINVAGHRLGTMEVERRW